MHGANGQPGWENVRRWFEGADAWPVANYTPGQSRAKTQYGLDLNTKSHRSELENIRFMESDDDIRYTVLGLLLLEQHGLDFDTWDVGKLWHSRLQYSQVCTAETQAYLNFGQVTAHMQPEKPDDWPEKLAWVRTHLNPYREWIGAQIRADGLAYGAAGNPQLAAELAWRDASFSHVKNGVYGEMYIAAIIAAAFVESDIEKLVEIGLAEIPANCRLAQDIRQAVQITQAAADQLDLVARLWEAFQHYNPVHTNNNAALVTAALLFGRGDFEKAITTAVLGGWDTDCNGATVGSIMGASLGAAALPDKWIAPLHDTLYAEVNGFQPIAISECASRSYEVFRKIVVSSR
jgi:ADP-ribosylglycohydrolase